jgi:hypothetical protein
MERLDERLGEHGRGLTSVDGKLGTVAGRLGPVDSKLSALDGRLGTVDGKVGTLSGQLDGLDGRLETLGQETLAKIVDAAQSDVTTQLGSLEETVLTLAEALLRPNAPQVPAPREASRGGSRASRRS